MLLGVDYLRDRIRTVSDWPKPGVEFRDITPLLQDPETFRVLVQHFVVRYMKREIDVVAGIDARGFILGAVVAHELNMVNPREPLPDAAGGTRMPVTSEEETTSSGARPWRPGAARC